jgi:hypothetical protein
MLLRKNHPEQLGFSMFPFCPEEMLKDTPKPVHVPERVL